MALDPRARLRVEATGVLAVRPSRVVALRPSGCPREARRRARWGGAIIDSCESGALAM